MEKWSALTDRVSGFTEVQRLSITPDLLGFDLRLELNRQSSEEHVTVLAKNIRNFRIDGEDGGFWQIEFLLIEDVSAWQHDRVRYRLTDTEGGRFSCICEDVEILESGDI